MSCSFRTPSIQTLLPSTASKTLAFYAVILHDFVAECLDKLGAKAGDSILVVVQSNRKWFVAKLIGHLGKPGLIPVLFVEVRDPAIVNAATITVKHTHCDVPLTRHD